MSRDLSQLRYHSQLRQSADERREETHPLTWRMRDDGQPVFLEEYARKDGYAAVELHFAY